MYISYIRHIATNAASSRLFPSITRARQDDIRVLRSLLLFRIAKRIKKGASESNKASLQLTPVRHGAEWSNISGSAACFAHEQGPVITSGNCWTGAYLRLFPSRASTPGGDHLPFSKVHSALASGHFASARAWKSHQSAILVSPSSFAVCCLSPDHSRITIP